MKSLGERAAEFAAYLRELDRHDDRGALADLRTGLGRSPGQAVRMHRHIIPYLGEQSDRTDRWFYLVGTLFPLHQVSLGDDEKRRSLGGSFGRIREQLSESGEERFLALLTCDSDDLSNRLRGAITFLASRGEGIGVDWARLIRDLSNWTHPDRNVQARWAREFYYHADDEVIGQHTINSEE